MVYLSSIQSEFQRIIKVNQKERKQFKKNNKHSEIIFALHWNN